MHLQSSFADKPLVSLRAAEKRYGRHTVLRVDGFELKPSDFLVVTGANGSGKSTFLRVLAGFSQLSSGDLSFSEDYEALRICFLPQSGGLHLNLSVLQNVRMWCRLIGSPVPDDLRHRWYVEAFDLGPRLDSLGGHLSGGLQRLAAIACVLAARPDGLFIDEPLSGIDASHARILADGLAGAMSELTFLAVTDHRVTNFPSAKRILDLSGHSQG